MRKTILKLLVDTLVIGAVFGIIVIITGAWNEMTAKVLGITGTIFGFSIPGLCCSTLYKKKNLNSFSTFGMFVCFISCLYIVLNILTDFELFDDNFDTQLKIILISILLSCSCGHISLICLIKSNDRLIINLRDATICLSVLIDVLWITRLLIENDDIMQIDAVLAIFISLGTIVVPIMNKIKNTNNSNNSTIETQDNNEIVDNPVIVHNQDELAEETVEMPKVQNSVEVENNTIGDLNKQDDKYEKIAKLKTLLDDNAITQEEYDSEKKKILEEE